MLRWTSRNGRSVATPKGSGSDSMRRLWHDSGSLWHDSGSLWLTLDFSLKQMETEVSESARHSDTSLETVSEWRARERHSGETSPVGVSRGASEGRVCGGNRSNGGLEEGEVGASFG